MMFSMEYLPNQRGVKIMPEQPKALRREKKKRRKQVKFAKRLLERRNYETIDTMTLLKASVLIEKVIVARKLSDFKKFIVSDAVKSKTNAVNLWNSLGGKIRGLKTG
jgi:hypothetical protein